MFTNIGRGRGDCRTAGCKLERRADQAISFANTTVIRTECMQEAAMGHLWVCRMLAMSRTRDAGTPAGSSLLSQVSPSAAARCGFDDNSEVFCVCATAIPVLEAGVCQHGVCADGVRQRLILPIIIRCSIKYPPCTGTGSLLACPMCLGSRKGPARFGQQSIRRRSAP